MRQKHAIIWTRIAALLVVLAASGALIEWSSCGGGSSTTPTPTPTPTVSSVSSSGGNAQTLTTSGIITNVSTATSSVVVTFSTTMAPTTVVAGTNALTLTCTSGTPPTIGTPTSTDNTTFTIPLTGTFPQLTPCTLAVGTGITSSAGIALESADTYSFTTGCSTSDNFANDATIVADTGCWVINNNPTTSIDTVAGTLTMSGIPPGPDSYQVPSISKTFTEGIAETTSITLTSGPGLGGCVLALGNTVATSGGLIVVIGSGVYQRAIGGASSTIVASATLPITFKLAYDGVSSIIPSVINSSGTTTLGTELTGLALGTTPTVTIGVGGETTDRPSCVFSNFTSTLSAINGPTETTGGQD